MDDPIRLVATYTRLPGSRELVPFDPAVHTDPRTVEWGAKQRWIKRMKDPAWYSRDWSSSTLIPVGQMPCDFYRVDRAGQEGMYEAVPHGATSEWKPGSREFSFSTRWDRVQQQIIDLARSSQADVQVN